MTSLSEVLSKKEKKKWGAGLEKAKERWGKNEIINQCLIRPKTSIFVGQNGAN